LLDKFGFEGILPSWHKKAVIQAIQESKEHFDVSVRELQEAVQVLAEPIPTRLRTEAAQHVREISQQRHRQVWMVVRTRSARARTENDHLRHLQPS
jgi:uncharacterized protein YjaG (DUF416 family)